MRKLYYDPAQASSFASRQKLETAVSKRSYPTGKIRDWLLRQDAYTLHRPARKRFPRNPYTVNNVGDLWELDLTDMSSLTSHNSGYKYLLNAIDAFSKFAYSVPIRFKTAEAVVSAFRSILARTGGRRPLVVRTDKGKEFVNVKFRKLLDTEEIEMRVCRNPDVKCAIVERFNMTSKSKLYKWFT
jgi:transposase InsO family protein